MKKERERLLYDIFGGFSGSNSFVMLCLWAIPYGLGAGSVDASLNNYVAL